MISITHKGDFNNIESFFKRIQKRKYLDALNKYGQRGVEALRAATPRDTGETASSWSYITKMTRNSYIIEWNNSHSTGQVPVAIILQYGHATGSGGYVQGIDYINPALENIFNDMANEAWKEVIR